jgi:O-antigen ligase
MSPPLIAEPTGLSPATRLPSPRSPSPRSPSQGEIRTGLIEPVLLGGLGLLLALAALPSLAAPSWLPDLMTLLTGVLLLLAIVLVGAGKLPLDMPARPLGVSLALAVLLLFWLIVQIAPAMPSAWVHPLWGVAVAALPGDGAAVSPRISLDPDAGLAAILALLRDGGVLLLVYLLGGADRRARALLLTIATIALLVGAVGLVLRLLGHTPSASLATEGGLGLVILLALQLERIAEPRPVLVTASTSSLRRWPAWPWWPGLGALLLVASVAAAGSLAGSFAAMIGLLTLLLAIALSPAMPRLRRSLAFALAFALAAGAFLVLDATMADRLGVAGSTLPATPVEIAAQAIADSPILGSGAGTTASVLRLYGAEATSREQPGAYLTAMVELGLPGAVALLVACAGLLVLCLSGTRRRRRNLLYPCLGVGAAFLTASAAFAGPALAEPGLAVTWCALMGIACAQSLPADERRTAWLG